MCNWGGMVINELFESNVKIKFDNLTNLRKPGNVIISNCSYNRLQQEE